MPSSKRSEDRARQRLAQECARIIAEEGIKDFRLAKRKACERLGLSQRVALPSNLEIEDALFEHQRLFNQNEQQELTHLRQIALEAMTFLQSFQPCLVGPVLKGIVMSRRPEVHLHVFAETNEELLLFLMEHDIPFDIAERRMRTGNQRHEQFPTVSFMVDDVAIDLTIFSPQNGREAPKSPIDGQPMRRAGMPEVRNLLT